MTEMERKIKKDDGKRERELGITRRLPGELGVTNGKCERGHPADIRSRGDTGNYWVTAFTLPICYPTVTRKSAGDTG